jgi:hypothetical protein
MKKTKLFILAATLASVTTIQAQSTIVHNITYDLGNLTDLANSGGKYWTGDGSAISVDPFLLQTGDTLVTTVNFLPGQSIFIHDGSTSWGQGFEDLAILFEYNGAQPAGAGNTSSTQLTFFTPSGNITMAGSTYYGNLPQGTSGNITDTSLEFTGFSMSSTVYVPTSPTLYNQFYFHDIISGQTDLLGVSPVPEPSTLALAGLGAVGLLFSLCKK